MEEGTLAQRTPAEWQLLFVKWTPSKGAVPLSLREVDRLLVFLGRWVEDERQIDFFGKGNGVFRNLRQLEEDGFNRFSLLAEFKAQLEQHKRLWRTRGRIRRDDTYESLLAVQTRKANAVRYFKFQMECEGDWTVGARVSGIRINYHVDEKSR